MQNQHETSGSGVTLPEWSGSFWITEECVGIMTIHHLDQRQHLPPRGWVLHDDYIDHGEEGEGETAVLIYRFDWEEFQSD